MSESDDADPVTETWAKQEAYKSLIERKPNTVGTKSAWKPALKCKHLTTRRSREFRSKSLKRGKTDKSQLCVKFSFLLAQIIPGWAYSSGLLRKLQKEILGCFDRKFRLIFKFDEFCTNMNQIPKHSKIWRGHLKFCFNMHWIVQNIYKFLVWWLNSTWMVRTLQVPAARVLLGWPLECRSVVIQLTSKFNNIANLSD